ncbi:membrane protease subunit (stomatin/prohibitin family) [Mucilaginibacter oryzae]|uniref:Membrane protease subunit (Stomatin/prohibitin family) n=1 Tax=Mucilaginibacter oryzae TaxID=468058 RepID=A0A316HEH1_9SPHI|nr:SPFH domain-containing protein [Mucilaginibacter oryzae]PWK79619.1 membrane protease subunit (stomatin/prohibitin family) [Mucilaginibacter oryzae]
MSLFSRLSAEFIDIIEWVDTTQNTLVWKFPRYDNAIKMGAKLIVRESQAAVFMNEGKVADVFMPGTYELQTGNMPILTTLMSWKYGFNSPFKADVYFVSLRQFTNQKWGTKNPVMLRDPEFGPVRLRAFGSFNFKVQDPKLFITEIAATNPEFVLEDINEQLRNTAVSRGMDAVAQSKIPVLDLAANYNEVGTMITQSIQPDFAEIGLLLTKLLVENISLPPEVEQILDKRSEMGILGNLGAYAQFQAANAIEKSAENTIGGNLGAAGMGLGVGAAMMGQVGNIFQQNQFNPNSPNASSAGDTPPALPTAQYHIAKDGKPDGPYTIIDLNAMVMNGQITRDTMVWKKGMAAWAPASAVDEVAGLFASVPPPIA